MTFFSLVSCSSVDVNLPSYDHLISQQTEQDGTICLRQRNIQGYALLDDEVIRFDSRGNNSYYLATTVSRCNSLKANFALALKGDFSEICGGKRDKVLTTSESCAIKSIFEFKSKADAFATFEKADKIRQNLRKELQEQVSAKKVETAA